MRSYGNSLESEIALANAVKVLSENSIGAAHGFNLYNLVVNPVVVDAPEDIVVSSIDDHALLQIAEALRENTRLKSFSVKPIDGAKQSKWTDVGTWAVADALKDHPTLTDVSLWDSSGFFNIASKLDAESKAGRAFLHILSGSAKIKRIEIYNSFNDRGVYLAELGERLHEKTELESLNIQDHSHPGPENTYTDSYMQSFCAGIANKKLRHISFSSNKLTDRSLAILAATLAEMKTLEIVSIYDCSNLTSESAEAIKTILLGNVNITSLDLHNNTNLLESHGMQYLCEVLPKLKNLQKLTLNKSGLDGIALNYLASIFKTHSIPVQSLFVSYNHIDDDFIAAIVSIIQHSKSLIMLDISSDSLKNHHIPMLVPVLSSPDQCRLQHFDCHTNDRIWDANYSLLQGALRSNTTLCCIDLGPSNPRLISKEYINKVNELLTVRAAGVGAHYGTFFQKYDDASIADTHSPVSISNQQMALSVFNRK